MHRLDYPTAHTVSHTIAEHFRHEVQAAGIKADIPDAATIERIINAVFWASLRREEGRAPTISVAYLPPAGTALLVEHPLPLDPATLTKLAPAVERPGIHLGVWDNGAGGGLAVLGRATRDPPPCLLLGVLGPHGRRGRPLQGGAGWVWGRARGRGGGGAQRSGGGGGVRQKDRENRVGAVRRARARPRADSRPHPGDGT